MKWPKFILIAILMLSCAQKQESLRFSVLEKLNQEPKKAPHTLNLKKDLLAEYNLEKASWFERLEKEKLARREYKKRNLFLVEQARTANEEMIGELASINSKMGEPGFSSEKLKRAFNEASEYQFLSDSEKRDPKKLEIGYCFYRALLTHYYLLEAGVPQDRIGKVSAIGTLVAPPVVWEFHVATFVFTGKNIQVLDPMFKEPITLKKWTQEITKLSGENPYPQLRFYASDPRKFLPNSAAYSKSLLEHKKVNDKTQRLLQFLENK